MNRRGFLKDGMMCAGLMRTSRLMTFGQGAPPAASQDQAPAAKALDVSKAVVVAPRGLSARERKAVQVLVEEVEKRTELRWAVVEHLTAEQPSAMVVGSRQVLREIQSELRGSLLTPTPLAGAEGYRLCTTGRSNGTLVLVEGADERGVLFGVGGLLRALRMSTGRVMLWGPVEVARAPKYRLRGHQLGYRPKTNAYDAWSVPMWD